MGSNSAHLTTLNFTLLHTFKILIIMSHQTFALQTIKTIEATARTRDAFKYNRLKTLTKTLATIGYAFLLFDLSPIAAQAVRYTDKRPQTSLIKPHIELKGITGDYYTLRSGEILPVFVSPQGKYFVIRPNGRKYYPKKLNK